MYITGILMTIVNRGSTLLANTVQYLLHNKEGNIEKQTAALYHVLLAHSSSRSSKDRQHNLEIKVVDTRYCLNWQQTTAIVVL